MYNECKSWGDTEWCCLHLLNNVTSRRLKYIQLRVSLTPRNYEYSLKVKGGVFFLTVTEHPKQ